MVALADVKSYLRVDSDVEDALITQFINEAKSHCRRCTDDFDSLYGTNADFTLLADEIIFMYVAYKFENRNHGDKTGSNDVDTFVKGKIAELQLFTTGVTTS